MSEQPSDEREREEATGAQPADGLLGRLTRGATRAADVARKTIEKQRPAAERAALDARKQVRRAADAARPEVERLARQAKVAAEAARPRVEQAARDAAHYAREHEEDVRRAAGRAARVAARSATPRSVRPAIQAFEEELHRGDGGEPPAPANGTDGANGTDQPG